MLCAIMKTPISRSPEQNHPSIKVASYLGGSIERVVHDCKGGIRSSCFCGWKLGVQRKVDEINFEDKEWTIQAQVEVPIFEGGRKSPKSGRTKPNWKPVKRYTTIRGLPHHQDIGRTIRPGAAGRTAKTWISLWNRRLSLRNHERFLNHIRRRIRRTVSTSP
jgi:hypothetical protein